MPVKGNEPVKKPEPMKIMSKPLPQILDEMDTNIEAATEAARRAEEAAKLANQAAISATKASKEAETRAIEAREAAGKAAEMPRALRRRLRLKLKPRPRPPSWLPKKPYARLKRLTASLKRHWKPLKKLLMKLPAEPRKPAARRFWGQRKR